MLWSHCVVAGGAKQCASLRQCHRACINFVSLAPRPCRKLRRGVASRASLGGAGAAADDDGLDGDAPVVPPLENSLASAARLERLYTSNKTTAEAEAEALRLAALKAEIQWSVQEAEATCSSDTATPNECAIAWEQVSELREAAARRAPPPPSTSLPPSKTSAAKPTAPARGLGDPLAGVTPAQVIGTVRDAPSTGSLQAAGRLERMMSGGTAPPPGPGARTAPPQGAAAAASIPDAIKAAVETCAEETGPACAAAWDEVEELSQHVSRKKQDV